MLATSAIMLPEKKKKRKMWSKKWYLKRNISCDADLLNELLETDVPWDDAIVVPAGKLRKLWGSPSELRSSVCERPLERTVRGPSLLPVKTAQFTQFYRQVWRHTVKSLFNWECRAALFTVQTRISHFCLFCHCGRCLFKIVQVTNLLSPSLTLIFVVP